MLNIRESKMSILRYSVLQGSGDTYFPLTFTEARDSVLPMQSIAFQITTTVRDTAEASCNPGSPAGLQSGTGGLRLCPWGWPAGAELLGARSLTRGRHRCDKAVTTPSKGRRDNLLSERDRQRKVSICQAIIFFAKSLGLGVFALGVVLCFRLAGYL